jgi:hypothetical protein
MDGKVLEKDLQQKRKLIEHQLSASSTEAEVTLRGHTSSATSIIHSQSSWVIQKGRKVTVATLDAVSGELKV